MIMIQNKELAAYRTKYAYIISVCLTTGRKYFPTKSIIRIAHDLYNILLLCIARTLSVIPRRLVEVRIYLNWSFNGTRLHTVANSNADYISLYRMYSRYHHLRLPFDSLLCLLASSVPRTLKAKSRHTWPQHETSKDKPCGCTIYALSVP